MTVTRGRRLAFFNSSGVMGGESLSEGGISASLGVIG